MTDAINAATAQGRGGLGALVVFSAGNTSDRQNLVLGQVIYPALLTQVVSVGAINRYGALTNYTPEYGRIDIVAPSGHLTGFCVGEVVTTDLLTSRGCNDGPDGNVDYSSTFSGTSAAAPQVAAVGALLLTKEPALSLAGVKSRLFSGADYWADTRTGNGKLNAYHTLVSPLNVTVSGPFPRFAGNYTYTASLSGGNGSYAYRWYYSYDGVNFQDTGITSQQYTTYVGVGDDYWIQVVVTSGPDQRSAKKHLIGPPS